MQAIIERLARLAADPPPRGASKAGGTKGVPFLGFVVYPERRRLKRRKGIYYQRKLSRLVRAYAMGQIPLEKLTASIQGWVNHVSYANTTGLRKAMLCQITLNT